MQGLRRVVAVCPLPSKLRKEELAAELGLTFSQVSVQCSRLATLIREGGFMVK